MSVCTICDLVMFGALSGRVGAVKPMEIAKTKVAIMRLATVGGTVHQTDLIKIDEKEVLVIILTMHCLKEVGSIIDADPC